MNIYIYRQEMLNITDDMRLQLMKSSYTTQVTDLQGGPKK